MSMQLCGAEDVRDAIEKGESISLILAKEIMIIKRSTKSFRWQKNQKFL